MKKGVVSKKASLQRMAMPSTIRLPTHELKRSADHDTLRHATYATAYGGIVINWAVRDL